MDSLTLLPQPSPEAMALLDKSRARHLLILPRAVENGVLHAFIDEQADTFLLENQVMALTGVLVEYFRQVFFKVKFVC